MFGCGMTNWEKKNTLWIFYKVWEIIDNYLCMWQFMNINDNLWTNCTATFVTSEPGVVSTIHYKRDCSWILCYTHDYLCTILKFCFEKLAHHWSCYPRITILHLAIKFKMYRYASSKISKLLLNYLILIVHKMQIICF